MTPPRRLSAVTIFYNLIPGSGSVHCTAKTVSSKLPKTYVTPDVHVCQMHACMGMHVKGGYHSLMLSLHDVMMQDTHHCSARFWIEAMDEHDT
jgi:hypothetical protein